MTRRLIVNADDFGLSSSVNRAVLAASREGILTTASLMVNEGGASEAVALARENPRLGVGLHLSLICASPSLSRAEIPGLLSKEKSCFGDNPALAGTRYFFCRKLHFQLEREIEAQFNKFQATGFPLDHVNGHLHFHLHPVVLRILLRRAKEWGIKALRLTREPLGLDLRLSHGHWFYRLSHAFLFSSLSKWATPFLKRQNIKHTERVFGLFQNGLVSENYVARLLECLPDGISELYSHPSFDDSKGELDALVSPRIRDIVQTRNIDLIRYQDLI